jgi:hypothetical protein
MVTGNHPDKHKNLFLSLSSGLYGLKIVVFQMICQKMNVVLWVGEVATCPTHNTTTTLVHIVQYQFILSFCNPELRFLSTDCFHSLGHFPCRVQVKSAHSQQQCPFPEFLHYLCAQ